MKYLLTNQETERLKFRPLQTEDFDTWVEVFKTRDIAKFLKIEPGLTPEEMCKLSFDKTFERYAEGDGGMNVIIDKKTNRLVGQCGLNIQIIDGEEQMEIGYAILPEFWKYGYAIEAAKKCKDFAFQNNLTDSLISLIQVDNIASIKVALKNGMTLEKRIDDFYVFKIHKRDWVENTL